MESSRSGKGHACCERYQELLFANREERFFSRARGRLIRGEGSQ